MLDYLFKKLKDFFTAPKQLEATELERQFSALGLDHCEGIDLATKLVLPTGREVRRVNGKWITQPHNDNYWARFDDLLDACRFALNKTKFPDSIIYDGLEDCKSFNSIKEDAKNWCKKYGVRFSLSDFKERFNEIQERDFQR